MGVHVRWMSASVVFVSTAAWITYGAAAAGSGAAQAPQPSNGGADVAAVFSTKCGGCHTVNPGPANRAPAPAALRERSPEAIVDALTGGSMRYQGLSLSGGERRALAEFLTGKKMGGDLTGAATARCTPQSAAASPAPLTDLASAPLWNGWGPGLENTHFQPSAQAGLTAEQVPHLTLKWAFGFPDTTSAWGQPTIAGGRLFVGGQNGTVYAMNPATGCVYWTFTAEGGVRTSLTIGRRTSAPAMYAAYFSDQKGYAYALDASTGALLWKRLVEDHPLIRLTGTPALYEGRLYVPTSSYEESGKGPDYPCCNFRGSIVALDATTGKEIWKSYTVTELPKVLGKNKDGIESLGPAGGAIWTAPTVDVKRGLIYATVGNTYSGQPQPVTDAVAAFDLKTGKLAWSKQLYPGDVYGCRVGEPNCTPRAGPDFDFGASAALAHLPNGRDALIVGQKSGVGFAIDPDKQGELLWEYRAGRGGALGGIEWGIATDREHAYFPVADAGAPQPGGLHAVNLVTGERVWFTPPPQPLKCGAPGRGCNGAQSAAITVIPGVVFSGSFDGGIRAFSTSDGSVLWEFDTNREFLTVNGVRAKGGALNGPAPTVAGGMVFVGSGDYRSRTGNVLLAFSVDGR
jgi:polyvinyl alcohol dehydrogenase (cytochrome)